MEFREIVDKLVEYEDSMASNFVTKEAICIRLIMRIAAVLNLSMNTVYSTMNEVKIDQTISKSFEKLWTKNKINHKLPWDFKSKMERFLSKDFFNPMELSRFCNSLQNVEDIGSTKAQLWSFFAVDGLNGNELKNYMRNLSIPLEFGEKPQDIVEAAEFLEEEEEEAAKVIHVKAVRSIYRYLANVNPESLGKMFQKIYFDDDPTCEKSSSSSDSENTSSDDDDDATTTTTTTTTNSEKCNEDRVEKYYRLLVGKNIDNISNWLKIEKEKIKKLEMKRQKSCSNRKRKSDE